MIESDYYRIELKDGDRFPWNYNYPVPESSERYVNFREIFVKRRIPKQTNDKNEESTKWYIKSENYHRK